MDFVRKISVGVISILCAIPPVSAQVTFQDVTRLSGVHFTGRSFGASTGDLNGDGWPDVFIGNHRGLDVLYLSNQDGTFTDVIPNYWQNPITPDAHGAAFGDFDNDGDQDLIQLVGAGSGFGEGPNLFFKSEPGRMLEQAKEMNLEYPVGRGRMSAWLDWNDDGILDLFLSNVKRSDGQGVSRLYQGLNGSFEVQDGVTESAGGLYSQLSTLGDDGSRYLVTHNLFSYPGAVYKLGDNPATDFRAQLSIPQTIFVGDTAIGDFDGDLRPDIYIARIDNSASEVFVSGKRVKARMLLTGDERAYSFRTSGNITITTGPFWEVTTDDIFIGSAGTHPAQTNFTLNASNTSTHGIANHAPAVDSGIFIGYDPIGGVWEVVASDGGRLDANILIWSSAEVTDLVTTNVDASSLRLKDRLLLNKPSGFVDAADGAIPGGNTSCESVSAGDFDNDMDLDIYLVCRTQTHNLGNRLLINQGDGTFVRAVDDGGASGSSKGRGEAVSMLDFDNDGFLDLYVTNGRGEEPFTNGPNQLFSNQGNNNRWLQFDFNGTTSNRDGIGAIVEVTTPDGTVQRREQDGGFHRVSQNSMRVHFGIARNARADVKVTWPSGVVDNFAAV